MNGVAKYVVSRTLEKAEWNNSTVIGADPVAAITRLKQQDGGDITVAGSATLVQWLLGQGLVDEIDLLIDPVVVGRGKRLFQDGLANTALTVVAFRDVRLRRAPRRVRAAAGLNPREK